MGDISDRQIDVIQVSFFCHVGDHVKITDIEGTVRKAHECTATDTGTDDMTDFFLGGFHKCGTGTHADNDRMIQTGKEQTALTGREEFRDTDRRDAQEISIRE